MPAEAAQKCTRNFTRPAIPLQSTRLVIDSTIHALHQHCVTQSALQTSSLPTITILIDSIYNTNLLQACCVHPQCASLVVQLELLLVLLLLMLAVAVIAASVQLPQLVQSCWQ
jgi:hypothetical protein